MNTRQLQTDSHEVQKAIYNLALSLDALLLNGIQYGVLRRPVFGDFLLKTAGNLLRDLACLEGQVEQVSAPPTKVTDVLAAIGGQCQQVVALVTGLESFRSLPLPQVRLAVSQVATLRAECVRLIQELETSVRTPKPFYRSRPQHSAEAIDACLSDLERAFVEEWTAANSVDAPA